MDASRGAVDQEPAATTIGRYRILRPCPVSPDQGPAHVAFDPERNEQVVVQLIDLPADRPMGSELLRLRSDVETSGRIDHPGLVPVRALGLDEQRGPYLVRGFADGPSLRALPKMEADLHAALRILIQVAHALTVADEAGVAPRRLRLESIFITPAGQVRLQVFGLPHAATPSSASSALQLARAGLKLIVGSLAAGEVVDDDAPLCLPAALDKGLAGAFTKALANEPSERFPTPIAFMQVLVAEAPLQEAAQQDLLELIDRPSPVLEDPVVASWVQLMWRERQPGQPDAPAETPSAVVVKLADRPRPKLELAPVEAPTPVPVAKKRGPGLLVAGVALVAALAAGGWAVLGGRQPAVLRVESAPPGAALVLDGRAVGVTPMEVIDPAPGAQLRLIKEGFSPSESTVVAGQAVLRVTLEPLPPPAAPPAQEPKGAEAPPPAGEAVKGATATVPDGGPAARPPAAEASAEPPRQAAKPAAPAKPTAKTPTTEKEKKRFDLYKHLEKQSRGP